MARVCVVLANGFEELEAVTLVDVLRRAEVEVVTLGVEGKLVQGSHGICMQADATLEESGHESWEMVILPGGLPGANTLRDNDDVQSLLRRQHEVGGLLAAICAAPIALGKAGVLRGRRATCYPSFEEQLIGAETSQARIVQDGTIHTSRGPGTALDFALHLAGVLVGEERADSLAKSMLARVAQ